MFILHYRDDSMHDGVGVCGGQFYLIARVGKLLAKGVVVIVLSI